MPHEARIQDMRTGLLNHRVVLRRVRALALMRIEARHAGVRAIQVDQGREPQAGFVFPGPQRATTVAGTYLVAGPARLAYIAALLQTAQVVEPFISYGELDAWASTWWARRRRGIWGLALPVGGEDRYHRPGQRATTVRPSTVDRAVEAIAHRLDPSHPIPDADYLDRGTPRKAIARIRALL